MFIGFSYLIPIIKRKNHRYDSFYSCSAIVDDNINIVIFRFLGKITSHSHEPIDKIEFRFKLLLKSTRFRLVTMGGYFPEKSKNNCVSIIIYDGTKIKWSKFS